MNISQILNTFDKHAFEFNFPVLDNSYLEFAAARITAFRSTEEWLIVFEVLGFSTREVSFVNDIYAYGSCIDSEGLVAEESVLESSSKSPIFDPNTNECIADWSHWSVICGRHEISFSPTPEEYAEAGIVVNQKSGQGSLRESELLRFLVHCLHEEELFLKDDALLSHFPKCRKVSKFIQTTKWQHPDIAAGERPSENKSVRTLLESLSLGISSLFDPGIPNTFWQYWVH